MAISPNELLPNNNIPQNNSFAQEVIGSPSPAPARGLPAIEEGTAPSEKAASFRGYTLEDFQNGVGQTGDTTNKLGGRSFPIEKQEVLNNQRFKNYSPLLNNESIAYGNQGGFSRAANAGANLIAKAVGYTLQNAGFVVGAPVAAATGDISNMTDNFLVKAGDYINKDITDRMPIYHSDKYTEGNIWNKLLSSSWWLDDGIDRLALTASMFIPGALEAKGIGLAGLAAKGLSAVAEAPETFGWVGKTFLPKLYKAAASGLVDAGTNPALKAYAQSLSRVELYSWNTIGQAALNAKETQDAIMKSTNDPVKAANGAKDAFWQTIPVTLASSLVELPQMFSTAKTAESYLNKFFNPETGEAIAGAIKPTSLWKTAGKAALTGLEHGQSESLQVAISRYNEDLAKGKDTRGTVEGIFGDFLDNINDPNGQNNIALGTIQGILTTIGGRAYAKFSGRAKEEQAQQQSLFNQIQAAKLQRRYYTTDLVQRDENGNVVVKDGNVVYDQKKLADAGLSLAGMQEAMQIKSKALADGDYLTASKIDHYSLAAFSQNFFDDPNGMEHLTSLLKLEAEAAKNNPDRINDLDAHGREITPDIQLANNLAKVDQFRKAYNAIEQRHAGFFNLNVDSKDKAEVLRAKQFIGDLKNKQYFESVNQFFIRDTIAKNASELGSLGVELPLDGKPIANPSNPLEQRANDLIHENTFLNKQFDASRINYQNLVNKEAQREAFNEDKKARDTVKETIKENQKQTASTVAEAKKPLTFKNSEGNDEEVKVGGQYINSSKKKFSITQDGAKWNVVKPDTTIHSAYDTKEEAEHKRDQFNAVLDVSSKLTVTGITPQGQLEVADNEGATHYLNPSSIAGYSKILTAEDKILKDTKKQSEFFQAQKKADKNNVISSLSPEEQEAEAKKLEEARKKEYGDSPYPRKRDAVLFGSDLVSSSSKKPSDIRQRVFMSKVDTLPNVSEIYGELIHSGNEESAGLTGITKLYAEKYVPTEGTEIILRVYRTKEGYIDQNGEIISPTKTNISKNNIVGKVFPFNVGEDERGEPYKHRILINSLQKIGENNYRIEAINKVNGSKYDMTINERGEIQSYTRNGKTYTEDINDEIVFPGDVIFEGTEQSSIDINKAIYAAMPTASLEDSYGKRYSGSDKTAKAYQQAWIAKRKEILASTKPITEGAYQYSRGVPKKVATGTNPIVNSLISRQQLKKPVIEVVTQNGELVHQNKTIKATQGSVWIHNGSTLELAKNRKLTAKEANVVFQALVNYVEYANAHPGAVDQQLKVFLSGILYFRSPYTKENDVVTKGKVGRNQIFYHDGFWHFGNKEKSIPFTKEATLANKDLLINEFLKEAYTNTNVYNVRENKPFEEITGWTSENKPITRQWQSYQHYLIDDKHPDGTDRKTEDIPLTTDIRQINKDVEGDVNFSSKYSYNPKLLTVKEDAPLSKGDEIFDIIAKNATENQQTGEAPVVQQANKVEQPIFTPEHGGEEKWGTPIESISLASQAKVEDFPTDPVPIKVVEDTKEAQLKKLLVPAPEGWNTQVKKGYKEFYASPETGGLTKVAGIPLESYEGFDFFILPRGKGDYIVIEASTGYSIGKYYSTQKEAKDDYKSYLSKKANWKDQINKAVSPLTKINRAPIAQREGKIGLGNINRSESQLRLVTTLDYAKADVEKEKAYIEERGFPVNVEKGLIDAGNGSFAHGMYVNAMITLSEKMEQGTGYHEYFHAIFDVFTNVAEKVKLYNEFGSREGSYIDRFGKEIKYSEATIDEANEQMAEEFRNKVLFNQMPPKSKKGNFIVDLFNRIWNYIKSLLTGNVRDINQLYQRADSHYYKNAPFKSVPTSQPKLKQRTLGTLDVKDTHVVISSVVSRIFQKMMGTESGLRIINELDFGGVIPSEYYNQVLNDLNTLYNNVFYKDIINQGYSEEQAKNTLSPIWNSIRDNWDAKDPDSVSVKKLSGEMLRTLSIVQNLEEGAMENESSDYAGRTQESYLQDSMTHDGKKSAPASFKVLLATMQESIFANENGQPVINEETGMKQVVSAKDQSTGLEKMVEYAKVFNFSLAKLNSFNTLKEKEAEILRLADQSPNYVRLTNRLFINDTNELSLDKWAIKVKAYNTLAKQRPKAYIQYIQKDGTTNIGSANPKDSIDEYKENWLQSIKQNRKLIRYENNTPILQPDALPKDTSTPSKAFEFLSTFGMDFTPAQQAIIAQNGQISTILKACSGIKQAFSGKKAINANALKNLRIGGPLDTIFKIYFDTKSLDPEGTFIGLEGTLRNAFPQTNAISRINNDINNAKSKSDVLEKLPHLNSPYSQDSIYINDRLFPDGEPSGEKLEIGYIQGIKDLRDDSEDEISRMTKADRLMTGVNANLVGKYYILLPADGKTEWLLQLKNILTIAETDGGTINNTVVDRFWKYYQTEQEMNKDGKKRLFSQMGIENGLSQEDFAIQLRQFVENEVEAQFKELSEYGIIEQKSKSLKWNGLNEDFAKGNHYNPKKLTQEQAKDVIRFRTANFMLNSTEMFKLYFGDPASYPSGAKYFKYFKNWLSPSEQSVYNTSDLDAALNKHYNTVANTELKQGDPGYINHKDYLHTVAMQDVLSDNEGLGYEAVNGADSGAWAPITSFRQIWMKNGWRWSEAHDKQTDFIIARDRLEMEKDGLYKYPSDQLKKYDESVMKKGNPHSATFNPIKPVVRGHTESSPIVDKYSIAPMTYYGTKRYNPDTKQLEPTNLSSQYVRMLNNGIDYMVMESGRKVGAQTLETLYDKEGNPNTTDYISDALTDISFKWFGIQQETRANKYNQTLGTQFSKLSTINLLSGGIPEDIADKNYDRWYGLTDDEKKEESPIYKLVAHEKEVRNAMIDDGYTRLLDKLGIVDANNTFLVNDKTKLNKILSTELYRREIADNIKDALEIDPLTKDFKIPLEAIPNYEMIKGIIYSYVDKYIASPKVNGGAKIQQPGTGWEFKGKRTVARTDKNGKTYYTNEGLKFYTKEQPWCEVGLPCHFAKQLRSAGIEMSDEDLIDTLNTDEGKRILTGLGFRIPTQDLNSVEVFRVAFFLPEEYGDTIVVPEEITKKSGSDFDVDKLNTYLKNIYINGNKEIKYVPYFDNKDDANEFFENEFFNILQFKIDKAKTGIQKTYNLISTIQNVVFGLAKEKTINKWTPIIRDMIGDSDDTVELEASLQSHLEDLGKNIKQLNDWDIQEVLLNEFKSKMYKQSLENEWFETTEKLLQLPQNFDRLITPNDVEDLHKLSRDLEKLNPDEFGEGNISKSVLSPTYMNNLRHINITGINARGIPVNNQNNTALSQKDMIYIDADRRYKLTDRNERHYVKDGAIKLPHNEVDFQGKTVSTISLNKDIKGKYISDIVSQFINGFVDIAKDPFLMKMGVTKDNAATFLMLIKHGVPANVVTYFMNQPIIREYQKLLSKKGFTYPYMDKLITETKNKFTVKKGVKDNNPYHDFPVKSVDGLSEWLKDNIETYYGNGRKDRDSYTLEMNALQHMILDEYLKYTVLSGNLYRIMYAGNWDTGNFPSPYLVERRNMKVRQAQVDNMYSSANAILNSTFEGTIQKNLTNATEAISTFFKFLNTEVRQYISPIIQSLGERKRLTDDDFTKASRKLEQSFINYLSQNINNDGYLNQDINEYLINEKTNFAKALTLLKKDIAEHPNSQIANNVIIQELQALEAKDVNDTKVIKIMNRAYDAYTSNIYTNSLREIKEWNPDFYASLIRTAFLQSGIGVSNISFTDIIPSEDFAKYILPSLQALSNTPLLEAFEDTDTFYRNSWKDVAIVPKDKKRAETDKYNPREDKVKNFFGNNEFEMMKATILYSLAASKGIKNGEIVTEKGSHEKGDYSFFRQNIWQPFKVYTQAKIFGSKFISWDRQMNISKEEIADRKQKGLPTQETVLLKRVEKDDGTPFMLGSGDFKYSLYIPVNAWGDGYKGQEHYADIRQSVYNNYTYKPEVELTNSEVIAALGGDYSEAETQDNVEKINITEGECP